MRDTSRGSHEIHTCEKTHSCESCKSSWLLTCDSSVLCPVSQGVVSHDSLQRLIPVRNHDSLQSRPPLWIMWKKLKAGPPEMPRRSWSNCGTKVSASQISVSRKWKTQLDWVIKPVPHDLMPYKDSFHDSLQRLIPMWSHNSLPVCIVQVI